MDLTLDGIGLIPEVGTAIKQLKKLDNLTGLKGLSKFMYNKLMGIICDKNGKFIKNADEINKIVSDLIKDIDRLKANYKEINELVENKGTEEVFETYYKYGIDVLETLAKYKDYYDQIIQIIQNTSDIITVLDFINKYGVNGINLLCRCGENAIVPISNTSKYLNNYLKDLNAEIEQCIKDNKFQTQFSPNKICIAIDLENGAIGYGCSGTFHYNPSVTLNNNSKLCNIENFYNSDFKDDINRPMGENWTLQHKKILSVSYIEEISKNEYISLDVKNELTKLSNAILYTENEVLRIPDVNVENYYSTPSFQKGWGITNCAEIWAARNAILNGAKFDNLVFQCYNVSDSTFAEPCYNCRRTFKNNLIIGDSKGIFIPSEYYSKYFEKYEKKVEQYENGN